MQLKIPIRTGNRKGVDIMFNSSSKMRARDLNEELQSELLEKQALAVIDSQRIVDGFKIMDEASEKTLEFILSYYEKLHYENENNRSSYTLTTYNNDDNQVVGIYESLPLYISSTLTFEFKKLILYKMITYPKFLDSGWVVYLTSQGKTYFKDKERTLMISKTYNRENTLSTPQTTNQISIRRKEYDVFISHANKDKLDYVDDLFTALKKLGINIFYDSDALSWGDNWQQVILGGTEKSEFAIIVISEKFFSREWTEKELNEFLKRQNESKQKIILPLLHGITFEKLRDHYPELSDIQSIKSENYTNEQIAILLAKELIKRYKLAYEDYK